MKLSAESHPARGAAPEPQTSHVYVDKTGQRSDSSGRVSFSYGLRIQPEGGPAFFRNTVITLEQTAGGWRVVAFFESDVQKN